MRDKILACWSGQISAIVLIVTVIACLHETNAINAGQAETVEDNKSKRGQIESFSSEATGLGDLEASDALKTINKRSIGRLKVVSSDDDGEIVRLLERLLKDRSQTGTEEGMQEKVESEKEFGGKVRGLTEETEGRRRQRRKNEVDLARQDRLKLFASPGRLARGGGGGGGDRIGSIAVARRTDEEETPEVMLQNQLGRNNFPLLGEFGSQISLLTTRKAEPARLFAQEGEGVDELGESSSYYPQILMNGLISKMGARVNEEEKNEALNGLSLADLSSNSLPRVARATNLIM